MRVNGRRRSRNHWLYEFPMPEDRRWTLFKRVWGTIGRAESLLVWAVLMAFATLPMLWLPLRLTCFGVASVLLVMIFTWQMRVIWIRNLRGDHPFVIAVSVMVSCSYVVSHIILTRLLVFGS